MKGGWIPLEMTVALLLENVGLGTGLVLVRSGELGRDPVKCSNLATMF